MRIAVTLEIAIAWTLLGSRDTRTVILGACLLTAYAHFSATRCAIGQFIDWWNDRNSPPPMAG